MFKERKSKKMNMKRVTNVTIDKKNHLTKYVWTQNRVQIVMQKLGLRLVSHKINRITIKARVELPLELQVLQI